MKELHTIKTISELHEVFGYDKPKHPLITFIDLTKTNWESLSEEFFFNMELYSIACKSFDGMLRYGRKFYDFQEGSLKFTAPGQVMSVGPDFKILEGWALYFHPDLLFGTALANKIGDYSFFNYDTSEALHISEDEKKILEICVENIEREYNQYTDQHTQELIVDFIQIMLNYCKRFYQRQFITRKKANCDIVSRFEILLKEYVSDSKLNSLGIPSVGYFADKINLSSSYLTDVLKHQTGKNSQEHIHLALIDKAKNMLMGTSLSVSEIAYNLGFEYPSHFSKLFKKKTGLSPKQFRVLS